MNKILIFGASGSGTTTLGKEIEKNTSFVHLDADEYYWKKTDPPYVDKIPLKQRNEKLKTDFHKNEHVVISGSLVSWGKEWKSLFDLAIFIYLESDIRMERLRRRELDRYGEEILHDHNRRQKFHAFMEWASQYDNPGFQGRSLNVHNEWIKELNCEVLRIDGSTPLIQKLNQIISTIKNYG